MSLRYALLAILQADAMSGYDLKELFESSVGHVWYAPDSQIYPELRKMEAEGLLEGEDVPGGRSGIKRRYHITPVGQEAFSEWVNAPITYPRDRDPARLHATYMETADPAVARKQLRTHIQHHSAQIQQWEAVVRQINTGTSAILNRRLARVSPEDRESTTAFKRYAYEGLILRSEAEISWAHRGLRLLDSLHGPEAKGESENTDTTQEATR